MYHAFAAGYDPVLELARASSESNGGRIKRIEQEFIDSVLDGKVVGEYLLLLGPKGVGKTTLLVEAMLKNDADGVAMMEGHEDPEVFRLRLGKCLEFEFNEDSFAGLFQRKDPREAGPLLDIERALNKLEKVAIRFRKERGRPLILIFNNIHFVHDVSNLSLRLSPMHSPDTHCTGRGWTFAPTHATATSGIVGSGGSLHDGLHVGRLPPVSPSQEVSNTNACPHRQGSHPVRNSYFPLEPNRCEWRTAARSKYLEGGVELARRAIEPVREVDGAA